MNNSHLHESHRESSADENIVGVNAHNLNLPRAPVIENNPIPLSAIPNTVQNNRFKFLRITEPSQNPYISSENRQHNLVPPRVFSLTEDNLIQSILTSNTADNRMNFPYPPENQRELLWNNYNLHELNITLFPAALVLMPPILSRTYSTYPNFLQPMMPNPNEMDESMLDREVARLEKLHRIR